MYIVNMFPSNGNVCGIEAAPEILNNKQSVFLPTEWMLHILHAPSSVLLPQ